MERQYNPHFRAQKTEVLQEGYLFVQASKWWHLQLSWLLPGTVLSSPQVETQQQDWGSDQDSGQGYKMEGSGVHTTDGLPLPCLTFITPGGRKHEFHWEEEFQRYLQGRKAKTGNKRTIPKI